MKIRPRDYQLEARNSVFNFFSKNAEGNPVIVMPTGTGKSIVIADFLETVFRYWPNQKILVLTHVKELIEQNYEKLISLWPQAPAGIYSAGLKRRDIHHRIIFAGIASIIKVVDKLGYVDLIMVDEAHMISPSEKTMYHKLITFLKTVNPNLRVIGLTATPYRLGHGHICEDNIFTHVCIDLSSMEVFNRFIAEGYLIPLVPKKTAYILDTDGVTVRGGEFVQGELQKAINKQDITFRALKEAIEHGHDRNCWLVFCSGVEHCLDVAEMLNTLGIPCEAVHSDTKPDDRDRILKDLKSGKLRAVTNNNVLTTGFDNPRIDMIVVLRPTQSTVLWVQMLGRGTRPFFTDGFDLSTVEGRLQSIAHSPKQNCLVLDFANNTKKLGPINDPVVPRKKGKGGGEAPVRECDCCNTWNHASLRYCGGKSKDDPTFDPNRGCGYEFPREVKFGESASTKELIAGELPVVETYKVSQITVDIHRKEGKPDAMKVTYYCGLRMFVDYVCIEHDGYAGKKARDWWRERTSTPLPASTVQAIGLSDTLLTATHLKVWTNKKYPEIMQYCYDGSAFGTQEPTNETIPVEKRPVIALKPYDFTKSPDDDFAFS